MTASTCCKCEGGCERESHGDHLCDGCKRDGCVSAMSADLADDLDPSIQNGRRGD